MRVILDSVTDGKVDWASVGEVYDMLDYKGMKIPVRAGKQAFIDEVFQMTLQYAHIKI